MPPEIKAWKIMARLHEIDAEKPHNLWDRRPARESILTHGGHSLSFAIQTDIRADRLEGRAD